MRMKKQDYKNTSGSDCWNYDHLWRKAEKVYGNNLDSIEFNVLTGLWCDVTCNLKNGKSEMLRVLG